MRKYRVLSAKHRVQALLGMAVAAGLMVSALPTAAQQAVAKHKAAEEVPANVVTLPSASPLYEIQIMVKAGSTQDAAGKEGTAALLGRMLLEGGFGDPKNPVTKEKLAEITRPWGEGAYPSVLVDKEATTLSMTVPRDALPQFVSRILKPMLTQPLFLQPELDRIRKEALVGIRSNLRFEQQEQLGLLALDDYVLEGTALDHLAQGTVRGLESVTRDDLQTYYAQHYHAGNMFASASITDPGALKSIVAALPAGVAAGRVSSRPAKPSSLEGHQLLIITQPNAIATGLHLGFPISVKRGDLDYWPLFVASVSFGLHRDSFGVLYKDIRDKRGFNYGDYSYVEYYAGRPAFLFPPPGTPRSQQYFSMWIRPVGHQYTHFILKAMAAELSDFIGHGMTSEQVEAAKQRTRTLYLNYAESKARQLGYRLDDMYYGMKDHGYLVEMLAELDKVNAERVNAAIKKYLQTANLKYVIVTNESVATKLAEDIAGGTNVQSKTPAEYHMSDPPTPEQKTILAQDEQWKAYKLDIPKENIRIVKAEQMFETAATPGSK